MKSFASLALMSFLSNAQLDFIPDDLKGGDEYDETLADIWPKREVTKVDIIPYGSKENPDDQASAKYYLTGEYVSIEQLTGELSFEISLTLHTPIQNTNWIYMVWFQIIDPYLTNPSRDFFEGYSCAVRYDISQVSSINGNFLYKIGYRGVKKLD